MCDNNLYICHYCVDYKTNSLSDMIRHFKRKNMCKCNTLFTYENSIILSKKKYKFNFDIKSLSKEDFIYIITHYNEDINIINTDFRNNNINKINNIKQINETSENLIPVKIDGYLYENMFENIFFNKLTNTYYCNKCIKEYSSLSSVRRHIIKGVCVKRQEINYIFDENNEKLNKIIKKEQEKQEIMNNQINYNNNNNYNNCNFLNNNNNNNTNNSTYNLNVKDFVHERYDISHIKDEYYLQKDFFLYHNLLKTIMQNKNNQNIFFSNNEAVIYTDNELNKMSSDKAGYMILEKLSQSFDEIFYKNDAETQKYYEFIQKYFRIMKGQYINDTIYKEYDIDEQKFIYTSNSRLFRSRDKYLAKMVTTLSPIKNDVRDHMSVSLDQINDIPMINPNIENYVSEKMRYRDLKNKD